MRTPPKDTELVMRMSSAAAARAEIDLEPLPQRGEEEAPDAA